MNLRYVDLADGRLARVGKWWGDVPDVVADYGEEAEPSCTFSAPNELTRDEGLRFEDCKHHGKPAPDGPKPLAQLFFQLLGNRIVDLEAMDSEPEAPGGVCPHSSGGHP